MCLIWEPVGVQNTFSFLNTLINLWNSMNLGIESGLFYQRNHQNVWDSKCALL